MNDDGLRVLPEGYVPRLRRREYELDEKRVVTGKPPEENPMPPPG
jgi:hypothetical protein